uniref:PawS-like protein 1a n=1 Tax=Buphthalmum salicifolium TaxID=56523 RepID=A0A1V0JB43_9ASTR|nr:PawS-like protein 1a [Buphthalmum salicifolium]
MANLAVFALACLAAMVAFAEVSAYRTTIITTTTTIEDNGFPPYVDGLPTELEDNSKGSQERCRNQIQDQQLNHCHLHLTQGPSFEDSMLLRMAVENPTQQDQHHLQQCCDQLKQVNEQCRCEAIKKVVQKAQMQQLQGGQQQQQQVQHMLKKAQMLPNQCNLQLIQQCPIQIPNRA